MKYRGSEIIVGAFVLAGLAVIIVGIFTIRGLGWGGLEEYHALYLNAAGIEVNTPVKYNGILRGRVHAITIDEADPTRVRITFSVQQGTPITTRTIAKITRADLLGDPYIDLRFMETTPGTVTGLTTPGEKLEPGSEIAAGDAFDLQATLDHAQQAIESLSDLADLMKGQLESIIGAVQRLLDSAESLLSEENRTRIEATLENLQTATGDVNDLLEANRSRIDGILRNADAATQKLGVVADRVDAAIQDVVPKASDLIDHSRVALDDVRKLLATANTTLRGVDVQQVNDLLANVETASRNLSDMSRDLKERPYKLLRTEKPLAPRFPGEAPAAGPRSK
jgi:phospholipid/cholesterol/gamma-HCH transport system substrate-binding protein